MPRKEGCDPSQGHGAHRHDREAQEQVPYRNSPPGSENERHEVHVEHDAPQRRERLAVPSKDAREDCGRRERNACGKWQGSDSDRNKGQRHRDAGEHCRAGNSASGGTPE